MRRGERLPRPALPVLASLALILACLALVTSSVAGLALAVALLVSLAVALALLAPLAVVLPPLVLACRSWPGWRWLWLFRLGWFFRPWSRLCRSLFRWPWLCWRWLR
jgi:hypothetical protein